MFLAEINNEGMCIGIKQASEHIDDGNHIEIDSFDNDYLWRKYVNGRWSEEKYFPDEPEPQTATEDKLNYIYYKLMGVI